jgi:ERCC4-type nuclease
MVKQIVKFYSLPKLPEVIIYADKRERVSGIVDELKNFSCRVDEKVLAVGDFILSDRVVVERKTTSDFLSSIIDGRLFKQLGELKHNFEKPILMIEGNDMNDEERVHVNVLRGALASVALDYGIPILWTKNVKETAGLIYWIARREQLDEKRTVAIRGSKKIRSVKEAQEFLVAGLPGISTVRAKEILKHFGSPLKFFLADEKEVIKVKKLGKKTAEKIKKILEKPYRGK